jgi:NTP-dependent ternary system trypsin peptidase co-occuring protein
MAEELTRFTLDGGGTVIVETRNPATRVENVGRAGKSVANAALSLRDALGSVTETASEVLAGFQSMSHRPDEVEIQLGVNFDAVFGMVIANASTGGHIEVTLRWAGGAAPDRPAGAPGRVPESEQGEAAVRSE